MAPGDSSLKCVFVGAVLRCWLAMLSFCSSCVCAVQRIVPKPRRASSDADSFSGGEGAAAIGDFFDPIGLRSDNAGAIAIAIAREARLHFTHSSSPLERHALLQCVLSMCHPDRYLGSVDVAQAVTQYLRKLI